MFYYLISYMRNQKSGKTTKNFRFSKLHLYEKIMSVMSQTKFMGKLTITLNTFILAGIHTNLRRKEDKWHIMEQAISQSEKDMNYDQDLFRRRALLAAQFQSLPTYGSAEFWSRIEEPQLKLALPLEVLVKCVRVAMTQEDSAGKNRIFEMIFRRTQATNEYWSRQVLSRIHLPPEERCMFAHDLYAELCERVIRALNDCNRLFWEENFQHCLCFERKHVYQTFMMREGRWYNQHTNESSTRRIPRSLIGSLDQPVQHANGESWEMDIVDEQAQQALLSVEQHDLPLLILNLPEKLKPVIWLIFWEGRTEKNVASILGVSDRTVRNRLQKALSLLHAVIDTEGKTIDG
jgi:RNA polymerase sigma factor (sigma-70 family)